MYICNTCGAEVVYSADDEIWECSDCTEIWGDEPIHLEPVELDDPFCAYDLGEPDA